MYKSDKTCYSLAIKDCAEERALSLPFFAEKKEDVQDTSAAFCQCGRWFCFMTPSF
jgi:hypothetical protein